MVVILKKNPDPNQLQWLISRLEEDGISINTSVGNTNTVLGLVGDTSHLDVNLISALDIVDDVKRIQEPYKIANRKFHPDDTVIQVGNTHIGGGNLTIIAGPCSVETEDQIVKIAQAVKASGATMLRGGAFKPRTSPYSFQGLGEKGLSLLKVAREITGLPVVTELLDESHLPLFKDIDVIQIGARNMQNYSLLQAVGHQEKPVLIKRGFSATYEEWIMSAEYVMKSGNQNVILCERGIRTFENYTRNTLDISCIPALRYLTHLPVLVDPSHATGKRWLVPYMAMGAVASGADGVMIEVHNDPERALCDGQESLKPDTFTSVVSHIMDIHNIAKRIEKPCPF